MVQNVSPTLINNTITKNNCISSSSSANGGGLRVYASGGFNGANNIVYGNYATTNPEYSGTVNFNYSCSSTPFGGGTGNISANPQFVNPNADNFYLQPTSPCIDTGDPGSPLDPDGSRADMGALYFDHSGAAVTITMTPQSPPIQIPASGGSFNFTVTIENNEMTPQTFAAWIMVTLPNGSPYGPVLGPLNLTLGAGISISRLRSQNVPATAPPGNYTYTGSVGVYPNGFWNWDSFPFTKLISGDGALVNGWENSGESFDHLLSEATPASDCELLEAYPNPFNPQSAIGYQLSANSHVRLEVFDAKGRMVATLVNGWREAGSHEVTWNASGLPSGLYFCRMQAGEFGAVSKMMLVK